MVAAGAGASGGRRSARARFFLQPPHVSDRRSARPHDRVRRARARGRRQAQISSTPARRRSSPKGQLLYNFATARAAALKAGTIVVAEGYMDVIALVRAGFEARSRRWGRRSPKTSWPFCGASAPEPILVFRRRRCGLAARPSAAARLALPHLKPGHSLRFAFLPAGEDPDSFIRAQGSAGMKKVLDAGVPLPQVLWRVETEGKDFSTPERRAGPRASPWREIVGQIGDGKIADYYRRDFDEKVFDTFKRRAPRPRPEAGSSGAGPRLQSPGRPVGGFQPIRSRPCRRPSATASWPDGPDRRPSGQGDGAGGPALRGTRRSAFATAKSLPHCRFPTLRLTGCAMNS